MTHSRSLPGAIQLFVAVPLLANTTMLVLSWIFTERLSGPGTFSNWLVLIFSYFACLSSFVAYFNGRVGDWAAILGVLANGGLTILVFAFTYVMADLVYAGPLKHNHLDVEQFGSAVYFSIVSFTTLGYGDFQSLGSTRSIAAMEALMGYFYLGMLVGVAMHWASTARSQGTA